jgi:hypothetical protein
VDLIKYRASRPARAPLPLFDAPPPARSAPPAIVPFRPLSEREIAHRVRMLAHLEAGRRDGDMLCR